MSNNSPAEEQELKQIASIVRALITSRKPPCYLKDILREYNEVESKHLPYRSLGYKTAQELLEDTGEFIFNGSYGSGDTIITAVFSKKTAHITSMIRSQKSSRPTRIVPVKAIRQPPRMPAIHSNGFGFGDRNNNSSNSFNSYNSRSSNSSSHHQQGQPQRSMDSHSQSKDLREKLNAKKNQKIPQQNSINDQRKSQLHQSQSGNQSKQLGPRPILGASKPSNAAKESQSSPEIRKSNPKPTQQPQPQQPQTQNSKQNNVQNPINKPTSITPQAEKQPMQTVGQRPQHRINMNQNNQQPAVIAPAQIPIIQPQSPPIANPSSNNLASRLQVQQQLQTQQQYTKTPLQVVKQVEPKKSSPPTGIQNRLNVVSHAPPPEFYNKRNISFGQFNAKIDAVDALVQYCRSKNFPAPRFNSIKGKFSRGTFSCCVHVNDTIFSTYPNEYETEYLARDACANRALEKLRIQEKKRPMPPCCFTDTELLDKLYTELLNHPHGIFAKNLPEWFETTFQQSLPDHWWTLIHTSSLFTTETGLSKVIIFANKDADKDFTPLGDKTKTIQIDPIRLPWSTENWNIYITHCTSTVEVWGRLFGADYNERYIALMNDVDVYMATKKERPVSITRKNIYLVSINDCWHRIRVEELDKSKGSALCFFIDFGDADWLPVDQLYICETHFLRLPAQAVPFSLYGLEDFEGNPYARKCLDDLLPTKSLVGKIFTKESEFYDTNSKFHGKIQIFFFDTSTQEDINLNHQLSDIMCSEATTPEITQQIPTNIIVTHVSDNGDIFIQVNGGDLKYVQVLLRQTVESKFKREQHKITFEDLKRSNMFLICDDDDANDVKWYRGSLAHADIKPDKNIYLMYFVDQGQTKLIDISKIFLLESLSLALTKFPEQALKVRLHNIPDITKNIVGRMRGLLPKQCEALARLVEPGSVPLVTIYTRLEVPGSEDILCTINDVIRIHHEFESCSDATSGGGGDSGVDDTAAPKFNLDFSKKAHNSSSGNLNSPSTPTINSFIDITRGLTLTTVPGSPQKASDLPKLSNYAPIPDIDKYFEVRITMSANPSNFIIQPYKDYPNLRTLMKELQEFCENNDEFIPTDMVEIGEAYAAKNPDGFFNRVTAVKKYGDIIHVSFCDFGDIVSLDSSQLKTLPLKFRQLPKMAVQAKLYGIKAANGDWTLEDCLSFRKLTVGKTFVSIVKNIIYDTENTLPTQILELELIDVTTDEDVFIHELLLNEKRAIKEN